MAHWSKRIEILQDKIISTDIHKVSKCPLGQKTYSFFLLLKALRSRLISPVLKSSNLGPHALDCYV